MKQVQSSSGFALLLTLVLVVLAAISLTGLARVSASAAVDSLGAVEDLQRRWAITSCRATLLDRSWAILEKAGRSSSEDNDPSEKPEASSLDSSHRMRRMICTLSGMEYEIALVDEQSKVNINILWSRLGPAKTRLVLKQLIHHSSGVNGSPHQVQLRPMSRFPVQRSGSGGSMLFGSYDQLVSGMTARQWMGVDQADGLSSMLTCWGSGKVHYRHAPDEVVEHACQGLVEPQIIRAFLSGRKRHPQKDLRELIDALDQIEVKSKSLLLNLLTDRSDCHALWVVAQGSQRSWYTLSVGTGTGGGSDPTGNEITVRPVMVRYDFSW